MAGAALLGVAVLVLTTLALLRLTRIAAGHRRQSLRAVTALGVVWVFCGRSARTSSPMRRSPPRARAGLAFHQVRACSAGVQDHAVFADEIRHDRFRHTPAASC